MNNELKLLLNQVDFILEKLIIDLITNLTEEELIELNQSINWYATLEPELDHILLPSHYTAFVKKDGVLYLQNKKGRLIEITQLTPFEIHDIFNSINY